MAARPLKLLRRFQRGIFLQRFSRNISHAAKTRTSTNINSPISTQLFPGLPTDGRNNVGSKRTFGAAPLDKIELLYQQCNTLLEQKHSLDSSRMTHDIPRMINEWTKLWGKESNSIKSKNHFVNEKEENMLRKGVVIVDRLAHLLLDTRETNIGSTRDRTNYESTLNLALSFWAKSPPSKINGPRAQQLMDRMEAAGLLSDNNNKGLLEKRQITYGAMIQAHCITIDDRNEAENGAMKALKLLNKMEAKNMHPPLRIYNSCIHGFAVRGMIDEAENLFEKLEKLSEVNSGLRPDVLTCSTVLNAYLKYKGEVRGKPLEKRADDLLDRMMRRYEATGDVQYRPNQYTFGTGKLSWVLCKSMHADNWFICVELGIVHKYACGYFVPLY